MYIMYVDESGSESVYDKSKYFITSGAIFHENDLDIMKQAIQNYKDNYFTGPLQNAEIHLHDMYKGKEQFYGLNLQQKLALLIPLYNLIGDLPIITIVIGIDKPKFAQLHSDLNEILDYGHILLVERFEKFLEEEENKGIIRIDKTTKPNMANLNQKDAHILKLINRIRKRGTRWQPPAKLIIEEPIFLQSSIRKGLQVADAVAYCASRYLYNDQDFAQFWQIIYSRFRKSGSGTVDGYGFRIYPK